MVERVREILMKAEEDDDIKALLLRINSPGGMVSLICDKINLFQNDGIPQRLKQLKNRTMVSKWALASGHPHMHEFG